MDPFAPAWLRIPAPPAAATVTSSSSASVTTSSSCRHQDQPAASSSFSFRPQYPLLTTGPVAAGSPIDWVRGYERSSPDHPSLRSVPTRATSLHDDHSLVTGENGSMTAAPAGQWKQMASGINGNNNNYPTGDRMRAKAASVSESSRQRLMHINNNSSSSGSSNTSTTTSSSSSSTSSSSSSFSSAVNKAPVMSGGAAGGVVPDFRELASFQFHTRSGSFGETTSRAGDCGSAGANVLSASSGFGTSSAAIDSAVCGSENDVNISAAAAAATTGGRVISNTANTVLAAATVSLNAPAASASAPVSKFNQEFPCLSLCQDSKNITSGTVWDSSAKLKVLGGSSMKKLWIKSSSISTGKDSNAATLVNGQQVNNKVSGYASKKASSSSSAAAAATTATSATSSAAMEILVKNPKISSSRSDFFKSLRSSSSSTTTTAGCISDDSSVTSSSNQTCATTDQSVTSLISSSCHYSLSPGSDGIQTQDDKEPKSAVFSRLQDDVFAQDLDQNGKENQENRIEAKKTVSTSIMDQKMTGVKSLNRDREEEDGINSIGHSADSILSSSLEAEQRLLKEMGWKEEDDFCEPLTEDEVREFRDLILARNNSAAVAAANSRSSGSGYMMANNNRKNNRSISSSSKNMMHYSSWTGRKSMDSSIASPQEFDDDDDDQSSSSSSDNSDEEDADEERAVQMLQPLS